MTTETTTTRPARRVAALAAALILVPIGVLTDACTSSTVRDAIYAESTTSHPCFVGSPGCGPLPRVPRNGQLSYDTAGPPPGNGPLRAGSYSGAVIASSASKQAGGVPGVHLGFTVPAGWSWNGRTLSKGNAAVSFYVQPVLVYADPCHWHRPQHPSHPREDDTGHIMRLLAAQPMRYASRPIVVSYDYVGDAAMAIRLAVPGNLDFSRCDQGQYRTWGVGRNTLLAHGPGQRDLIWISPVAWDPPGLIVDAATFPNTSTRLVHQVDAILASVGGCAACG